MGESSRNIYIVDGLSKSFKSHEESRVETQVIEKKDEGHDTCVEEMAQTKYFMNPLLAKNSG